ncbi:MAG: hypothetical protein ABIN69_06345 [Aestuariivirga sp.]
MQQHSMYHRTAASGYEFEMADDIGYANSRFIRPRQNAKNPAPQTGFVRSKPKTVAKEELDKWIRAI